MNQGKLDMVKQEIVRVNISILGISELKWTGQDELDSDEHYIYYCGQVLSCVPLWQPHGLHVACQAPQSM